MKQFFRLLLISLLLWGYQPQALSAITVQDTAGRTVSLPKPAERVVLGFYYEDFIAVVGPKAIDKIAALSLTPWKNWRPNQYAAYAKAFPRLTDIPDVGATDSGDFSIEKVIAAKPDLVILPAWAYNALGESILQLERAGIPIVVLDYNAQTVEKHILSTEVLGKVMGAEDRALKLIDQYKNAISEVDARIKKANPINTKVYIEVGSKGATVIGNSYANDMWGGIVNRLNGENIAKGKLQKLGPLSPEYVLSENPDMIFISGSEWLSTPDAVTMGFGIEPIITKQRVAPYFDRSGWSEISAIKQGRVHVLYHGGVRSLSDYVYFQYIAKQLYPEIFSDTDPEQNLRDYYKAWLPIPADGLFMWQYNGNPS